MPSHTRAEQRKNQIASLLGGQRQQVLGGGSSANPRLQALAAALASQGQQPIARNRGEAIAQGLRGFGSAFSAIKGQQKEGADAQARQETLARALSAGQTGVKEFINPDTGKVAIPGQEPGLAAITDVLSRSDDPRLQEFALKTQIGQLTKDPRKRSLDFVKDAEGNIIALDRQTGERFTPGQVPPTDGSPQQGALPQRGGLVTQRPPLTDGRIEPVAEAKRTEPLFDIQSELPADFNTLGPQSKKAARKIAIEAVAKKRKLFPKAKGSATSILKKADSSIAIIDDALERVGPLTAGLVGAGLSLIPGTEASDLEKNIKTLLARAGFGTLQEMRDNSPTGGALGQVSERELDLLQSAVTNLENSQGPEQLTENLQKFRAILVDQKATVSTAFSSDFGVDLDVGGGQQKPANVPQALWDVMSPEDRRAF